MTGAAARSRCGRGSWLAFLLAAAGVAAPAARAEVEKLALPRGDDLVVYWWPHLPVLPGWTQDGAASRRHRINAYVPEGTRFADAPAVIYATAIYKGHVPETRSLAALVAADKRATLHHAPGTTVTDCAALVDADGTAHRCLEYRPAGEGSHDVVAYGEEGGFYLVFTLSAPSAAALDAARGDFVRLIAAYRAQPLPAPTPAPPEAAPKPAGEQTPETALDPPAPAP